MSIEKSPKDGETKLSPIKKHIVSGGVFAAEFEDDTVIKVKSSQTVFNLPLYETYLVVDCRETGYYAKGRIMSAFSYPPVKKCANMTANEKALYLRSFTNYMAENYTNERWNPIVLYCSQQYNEDECCHLIEFAKILKKQIICRSKKVDPTKEPSDFERFLYQIAERTEEVYILQEGYEGFACKYHSLCSAPDFDTQDRTGVSGMKPLPYHLSDQGKGLFISSRAVKWTPEFLDSFDVDAVVGDFDSATAISDAVASCLRVVEVFKCGLPDHGEEGQWTRAQMHKLFDNTTAFIQESLENNKRVVVHLYGRSYSAAICVAWFMRFHKMTMEEAIQWVMSLTPTQCSSQTSVLNLGLLCTRDLATWNKGACITKSTIEDESAEDGQNLLK